MGVQNYTELHRNLWVSRITQNYTVIYGCPELQFRITLHIEYRNLWVSRITVLCDTLSTVIYGCPELQCPELHYRNLWVSRITVQRNGQPCWPVLCDTLSTVIYGCPELQCPELQCPELHYNAELHRNLWVSRITVQNYTTH
jgi:hypothetical protein